MNDGTASRPRVKICGLTDEADRDAAVRAGADALGFITDVPVETSREVSVDRASTLVSGAPPFVTTVLVTMPDSVGDAVALQERVSADAVQIHSGLAPAELEQLRERVDANVVGTVDVTDENITAYAEAADAVLVDSTDEQGAGGTGETHNWEQTRRLVERVETPVVLAGGLTPENVAAAVDAVGPFAVDTASGVERKGGRKDHDAVAAFVAGATGVSVP
ncbi:phosphoribosylanthranilate isomerase [Halovenus salina]|uniref:phosphoribosylanthranilate isomerase n=1 Tax=Halovenus salina TaxID=1510225 RepID=UPI002260D91C|nr:phosphoribosylanthranilate isomerase [Halovenus salina]